MELEAAVAAVVSAAARPPRLFGELGLVSVAGAERALRQEADSWEAVPAAAKTSGRTERGSLSSMKQGWIFEQEFPS